MKYIQIPANPNFSGSSTGTNTTGVFNAVLPSSIGSGLSSNILPCVNCETLSIYVDVTWAAASAINFNIQYSDDLGAIAAPVNFYYLQTSSISGGVDTLSNYQANKTVTASTTFVDNVDCYGHNYFKIVGLFGPSATTDTVSVHCILVQRN